jgi:para-nitrobenzyl esterase
MTGSWRGVVLLILLATTPSLAQVPIKVVANQERLVGELREGIANFRAIPFARPPVGELRWRAPSPPIPRQGPQVATEFAPACMQTAYMTQWYQDVVAAFDGDIAEAAVPNAVSEDCLYLNVWSPDVAAEEKLPVMVFIHGGNNQGGWSYEPNYMGAELAKKGVVLVSITYRQHVFGFLAHPELSAESADASSGNYGLLDQVAALQWVNHHIEHFGGDKENVTLFGESAGAMNIGHLMVSPLARGLYKNVIRQSGSFDINYQDTLAREEVYGVGFAASLGKRALSDLRGLSAEQVLAGAEAYYFSDYENKDRTYFYGLLDDHFRSEPILDLYNSGKVNPGNLLLGTTADEKRMYTSASASQADIDAFIEKFFVPGSKQKLMDLLAEQPSDQLKLAELKSAQEQTCTAQLQADAFSRHGLGDVYMYLFNRVRTGAGGERFGAYHGAELPYIFGTHDDWLDTTEDDLQLTEVMMDYWVNFAKTGNPNGQGLTPWPRYDRDARQTLELAPKIRVMPPPNRGLCDLMKPPQPA